MSGYIGTQPVPQATQTRDSFTATAGQTSFATGGYTPSFLDVYLNGVHLQNGTDYTAANGSDVVLTTGAALDDVLEVVAYSTYEVNSQNYTGGLTVDNDGATVLTVDRATSDGTIIDVQKGGSTVGSIANAGANLAIGSDDVGLLFGGSFATPAIGARNMTAASDNDGGINLGWSTNRFKDAYLSGGVYLGGTGSANKLDDYEEGTFTPELQNVTVSYSSRGGNYTKIGRLVYCDVYFNVSSLDTSDGSGIHVAGLPFTARAGMGAILGSLGQTSSLLGSKANINIGFANQSGGANAFLFEPNANSNYIVYREIASSGQLNLCLMYYTN